MGKRGPAPKPTNLKLLHGDDRKNPQRINRTEPVPAPDGCPPPPSWLSRDAAKMWRRLAPDLHRKGVLTPWDVDAFAAVCSSYVTWRDAQRRVDADGVLVERESGEIKNPACQVARDAWSTFLQGAARFGLTPSDRSQLKVGEDHDAKEDLLSG